MRICSLREHTLKHEWNQMVWSVNNLRCGTAATRADSSEISGVPTARSCTSGGRYSSVASVFSVLDVLVCCETNLNTEDTKSTEGTER